MNKKSIWLIGSLFILLISCKKTVSELPPATQTGANTFGCSVNGTLWVPMGFGVVSTSPILEARFMPGRDLIINARNFASSPTETEFELFIKGATAEGSYSFNTTVGYPSSNASYAYYVKRRVTTLNEWITSSTYTGTITITKIDSISHFVSGTFQFQAINMYNAPEVLTVTDGRFDVKTQ